MTDPLALRERHLWEARRAGFAAGEFVGQQSFVSVSELRWLAAHARVGAGSRVLDVCCGLAGPGLWLAGEYGCAYLGIDADEEAIATARRRAAAAGLRADFEVHRVLPIPDGPFDIVLVLETLLAFRDKAALLSQIAAALAPGGRVALTVEAGAPLTDTERTAMPGADTVWPTTLAELRADLRDAGLRVVETIDCTPAHARVAGAIADAYETRASALDPLIGAPVRSDLVAGHRLWAQWLRSGRIRKVALVACLAE
ncbi:SAM-dependent methyltransferase [Kribbia dieselivorans]|uniref:SAM-dependent methyltransferase n=1 Tax=Kribbia dieselivorans TaxID=331526 RepID=UPI000838AC7C|nr:methyltransferase domain-containing protein [Kribbia dieselivorans]